MILHCHGRNFSLSLLDFLARSEPFENSKSFDRYDNGLLANNLDKRENPGGCAGIGEIHYRALHLARVGKRRTDFLRARNEGIGNEESNSVTRSRRSSPLTKRFRRTSSHSI